MDGAFQARIFAIRDGVFVKEDETIGFRFGIIIHGTTDVAGPRIF